MKHTLLIFLASTGLGFSQSIDLTPSHDLPVYPKHTDLPFADRNPTLLQQEQTTIEEQGKLEQQRKLEERKQKPLGYEAATGLRSHYIYRGRELADETFDLQIHGYFSYADNKHLEYGIWHAGEQGSGDFRETGVLLSYLEEHGSWTYGVSAKYKHIDDTIFDSGAELNFTTSYFFNQDNTLSSEISYDTGADGFYAKIQYDKYAELGQQSFLHLQLGVSFTEDYYESHRFDENDDNGGFNDFFAKLTYTHNFTQQVSLSPFISTSIQRNEANFSAGIWFETSF